MNETITNVTRFANPYLTCNRCDRWITGAANLGEGDTITGLSSGALTEIDLGKPGDVQAFKDAATAQAERGVAIAWEPEDD